MTGGGSDTKKESKKWCPGESWESFSQLEGRKTSIRNRALVLTVCKNNHNFNVTGQIFSTLHRVANTVLDIIAFYILHLNIPPEGRARKYLAKLREVRTLNVKT